MTREDTKRVYGFLTKEMIEETLASYNIPRDQGKGWTRKKLKALGLDENEVEEIYYLHKAYITLHTIHI